MARKQKWVVPFRRNRKNYENVGYMPYVLEHDIGFAGDKLYHAMKFSPNSGFHKEGPLRYKRAEAIADIKALAGGGRAANPPARACVTLTVRDLRAVYNAGVKGRRIVVGKSVASNPSRLGRVRYVKKSKRGGGGRLRKLSDLRRTRAGRNRRTR